MSEVVEVAAQTFVVWLIAMMFWAFVPWRPIVIVLAWPPRVKFFERKGPGEIW